MDKDKEFILEFTWETWLFYKNACSSRTAARCGYLYEAYGSFRAALEIADRFDLVSFFL